MKASQICDVCLGPDGQRRDFIPALINKCLGILKGLKAESPQNSSSDVQNKEDLPFYQDFEDVNLLKEEASPEPNPDVAECPPLTYCNKFIGISTSLFPPLLPTSELCDPYQPSFCENSTLHSPPGTFEFCDVVQQSGSSTISCNKFICPVTLNSSPHTSKLCDPIEQDKINEASSVQNLFSCGYCNVEFLYKKSLVLHVKKRHQAHIMQVKCEQDLSENENIAENSLPFYNSEETMKQNYKGAIDSETTNVTRLPDLNSELITNNNKYYETEFNVNPNAESAHHDPICIVNSFSLAMADKIHDQQDIDKYCSTTVEKTIKKCQGSVNKLYKKLEVATCFDDSLRDCPKCCETFSSGFLMYSHILKHHCNATKSETFPCAFCEKIYTSRQGFMYHIKKHLSIKLPKFQCEFCNSKYQTSKKLKIHILHGHIEKNESHTCNVCSKTFVRNKNFMKHICSSSKDQSYFICCYCDKLLKSKQALKYHIQTQHLKAKNACKRKGKKKTFDFMCHICGRRLASKQCLNAHLARKHSVQKSIEKKAIVNLFAPKICNFCGKELHSNIAMKQHIMSYHTEWEKNDESKFECNFCHRWFSKKTAIINHIRHHDDLTKHLS